MNKTTAKLVVILSALILTAFSVIKVKAFPDYLKLYAADPSSKPEMRRQCSVCHISPQGGGERNAFGKAFEAAGFKINDELRQRFPDRFALPGAAQTPPVTFVQGSDSQAIVEINGKKFLIDTKTRAVREVGEQQVATVTPAPAVTPAPSPSPTVDENPNAYKQMDVRLINLPTAKAIPKNSVWVDFTHRFPFGEFDVTDGTGLWGLDGFAIPSFGLIYGVTDRIHVGAYRSPDAIGRPISVYAGASLLDEHRNHPLTAMARVGIEGRDNFQRNFTTSLELTVARSITSKAQLYLVPTISFNNRPQGPTEFNLPGETTFALGVGGAFNIRPSVALMADAIMRVNKEGRFGSTRPAFGFGVEKVSASGKHAFALVFTNSFGTTMAQRSATRASLLGPRVDESPKGLTIGFNLSRRLF